MKVLRTWCLLFIALVVCSAEGKKNPKKESDLHTADEGADLEQRLNTYDWRNSYSGKYDNSWRKRWGYKKTTGQRTQSRKPKKEKSLEISWPDIYDLTAEESTEVDADNYIQRPIYRQTAPPTSLTAQWSLDESDDSSDWQLQDDDTSEEWGNTRRYRFGNFDIFNLWSSKDSNKKKGSHDHSKGSHDHSKGSHDHSKGRGKHSRKQSKSSSSESSESSGWSEEDSGEERMSTSWCEKVCWKWASHYKNFKRLFKCAVGVRASSRRAKSQIIEYCKQKVSESGIICNYNVTITTTEPPTTTELVSTTERTARRCKTDLECDADECCLMTWQGTTRGLYCSRYGEEGDFCIQDAFSSGSSLLQRVLPRVTCPCGDGLVCRNMLLALNMSSFGNSFCERDTRMTRTTPTPSQGTTAVQPMTTTTDNNASPPIPEGLGNSTTIPPIPCSSRFDCPFLECCANNQMLGGGQGVCMPYSSEGDFCTQLHIMEEQPVIAACPCQSNLKCARTNTDVNGAYGICV